MLRKMRVHQRVLEAQERCVRKTRGGADMIDNIISLIIGLMIGANLGFIFAGLFGGVQDEDVPD